VEIVEIPNEAKQYPQFVKFLKRESRDVFLGIAPLKNTNFNNMKSSLKILEYAGLSLSVIASDVDAYREIGKLAPFVTLIENQTKKWIDMVEKSINRKKHVLEEGIDMYNWVKNNHTFDQQEDYNILVNRVFGD